MQISQKPDTPGVENGVLQACKDFHDFMKKKGICLDADDIPYSPENILKALLAESSTKKRPAITASFFSTLSGGDSEDFLSYIGSSEIVQSNIDALKGKIAVNRSIDPEDNEAVQALLGALLTYKNLISNLVEQEKEEKRNTVSKIY